MKTINSMRLTLRIFTLFIVCTAFIGKQLQAQVAADSLPNIVFILVDDGRYDEYRPTGGPSWFVAPNIERIANEGANFTRAYATTPICGPSRASIYTGLYPSQHGSEVNGDFYDTSLVMIQEILKAQGYYTGFIGKYGSENNIPADFDFWLMNPQEESYKDVTFLFNGVALYCPGHITDVYNTFIQRFLDSAAVHSDQPFALFFFTNIPHPPNAPRAVDKTLYDAEVMPFPDNFYRYTSVYPDYYYEGTTDWTKDSLQTVKFTKDRFACLKGVDYNVQTIFNFLDGAGITDQTMMIYSSDNGYMSGEHQMRAKAYPIEESFHIPLFIRYPAWFEANDVVDDDMAEIVDIPKTILKACGGEDIYNYQGYSLDELTTPDTIRHFARYELARLEDGAFDVPQIRGIRSFDHLYMHTWSDCYVEELYDFTTDPNENQNQILNPDYADLISFYKGQLDIMMDEIGDNTEPLVNDGRLVGAFEVEDGIDNDCDGLIDDSITLITLYPDLDFDGYGTDAGAITSYYPVAGYVEISGDCNDANNTIHPGALDYCDGINNDCDATTDEDVVTPVISYGASLSFCQGSYITLTVSPYIPGFTYQWYKGATILAGATGLSYNVAQTGNFKVRMTGPLGCVTTSAPVSTTALSKPKPVITNVNGTNDLCVVATINLKTKNKPLNTYQWSKNGAIITGATTNIYGANTPGDYKVKQTDENGCSGSSLPYTLVKPCRESEVDGDVAGLLLYPNPATGSVNLMIQNSVDCNTEAQIEIYNSIGERIYFEETGVSNGEVSTQIDISNIPTGIYYVVCSIGANRFTKQLIIN